MAERKKLSDILRNGDCDRLDKVWSTTKSADDLKPLPSGEYRFRVLSGELFNSQGGTPGYKLTLEVLDGEHAGRRVWHDAWLTDAALPMAKRDLAKLGIQRPEQLERPLPDGIIVKARVALRRNDDGTEYNRVVRFALVAVEPPAPEPFAPTDDEPSGAGDAEATDAETTDADGFDWRKGEPRNGVPTL
jgi:hypothetical protein